MDAAGRRLPDATEARQLRNRLLRYIKSASASEIKQFMQILARLSAGRNHKGNVPRRGRRGGS